MAEVAPHGTVPGVCAACGESVAEGSLFCGNCGSPVTPSGAAGAPSPPIAPDAAAEPTPAVAGSGPAASLVAPPPGILPPPVLPRRKSRWIATGAIIVAAIVVLGVVLLTAGFFGGSTGTAYGTATGSAPTMERMNAAAYGSPGGPWTPIELFALNATSSTVMSASDFEENFFVCNAITTIDAPSAITIYATPSSSPSGAAAFWVGYYLSQSSGLYLLTYSSGNTTLVMYTGSDCQYLLGTSNITGGISSAEAVNVTNANGGAAFLASNSVPDQIFTLSDNSSFAFSWSILYDTCALIDSGSGTVFVGEVDASAGSWIGGTTESCGP